MGNNLFEEIQTEETLAVNQLLTNRIMYLAGKYKLTEVQLAACLVDNLTSVLATSPADMQGLIEEICKRIPKVVARRRANKVGAMCALALMLARVFCQNNPDAGDPGLELPPDFQERLKQHRAKRGE